MILAIFQTVEKATATDYFKINFIELLASMLLMFLFSSFAMAIVKYFSTTKSKMIIPDSTTNETVTVLNNRLPEYVWFGIQTVIFALTIYVIRTAFDSPVTFNLTNLGTLALLEMTIAFGFLTITVPRFGIPIVEKLAFNIVKSQLQSRAGEISITPEEYMKLGNTEEKNP